MTGGAADPHGDRHPEGRQGPQPHPHGDPGPRPDPDGAPHPHPHQDQDGNPDPRQDQDGNPDPDRAALLAFLERLKRDRGLPLWHPRGPRAHPFLAFCAVVVLGGLLGGSVYLTAAELVRGAAFGHHARTVAATVVEVRHGDPVVSFTAAGGERVTARAHGAYRHGAPREVAARVLDGHPGEVALADHRWTPWWVLPLGAAAVFAVHARRAPTGIRGGWAWRRARTHVRGPEPGGWTRRAAARPALGAAALLTLAAALAALPLALGDVPGLAADPGGLVPLVPATVCVVGAATVAVRAAYRWAERVPAPEPPRPFRPLSPGWFWVPALAALASAAVWGIAAPLADRPEHQERGTAEVVGVDCEVRGRGACTPRLVLRYEVDGLPYVEEVGGGHVRGGVPVEWDPDDPADVRIAR
ncbi:hypothetical protein SAMN05421803_12252 [Nocardiopsis flavescens]|uniref:Uncharacterized protein n=1 Tax=Nocardiopsis flavescens TaxID=758803 RepID=A0A1M6T5T9_9ACTN|nr:hypothetical protein SAMN05421803_12252 [Nocardiopsis flavescens]